LRFGCGFVLGRGGGCGRFVFVADRRTTEAKVIVATLSVPKVCHVTFVVSHSARRPRWRKEVCAQAQVV
jgi:hypothetical protein